MTNKIHSRAREISNDLGRNIMNTSADGSVEYKTGHRDARHAAAELAATAGSDFEELLNSVVETYVVAIVDDGEIHVQAASTEERAQDLVLSYVQNEYEFNGDEFDAAEISNHIGSMGASLLWTIHKKTNPHFMELDTPDHINALKPVGIDDVDTQIEGVVWDIITKYYQFFVETKPEDRSPILLTYEVTLQNEPRVQNENDVFEVVIDDDRKIWSRFRSEAEFEWTHREVKTILENHGVRRCLRKRIKDFLNYPQYLDQEAEGELIVKVGEGALHPIAAEYEPLNGAMQQDLGLARILKSVEVIERDESAEATIIRR